MAESINGIIDVRYHFGDDLISQGRGADVHYFHTDGLGSSRVLTDASGNKTDTYAYSAFGEVLNQDCLTDNDYLYTGEQYDEVLDQYYLRARYYDQGGGRFTQQDTWMGNSTDPVTLHKYLYGNADPANVTDPTGYFGLASFSAANSIRAELIGIQIDVGLSVLDVALDPSGAEQRGPNSMLVGIASLGGPAAFKLLRMLSGKFRQACAANSFIGDTLVSTEFGLKEISEIEIGDKVWAYDEESVETVLHEVIHLIRGEGEKSLVDVTLASGETITATAGHPMFSANQQHWVDAGELTLDDLLRDIDGVDESIVGLRKYSEKANVYNLTVANDHTYFVGVDEVLGHNSNGCRAFNPSDVPAFLRKGTQKRHIRGTTEWERSGSKGYFETMEDAEEIIVAIQNGTARILGKTKSGDFLVQYRAGKGFNNNVSNGYENQPTDKYVVKGSMHNRASVFPTSPKAAPAILVKMK